MPNVAATTLLLLALSYLGSKATLAEDRPPSLDPEQVSQFTDRFFERALQTSGVPGAVVAVVEDDSVVLLRGYGVADIETGRPTDPNSTLYRLGSITKVLTGVAVLQLVDQGRLDLDGPATSYLGPYTFPSAGELTLRQLLTHRGGLDSDPTGSLTAPGSGGTSIEATVRRLQRVRPSSDVAAYDILGWGVLGLVLSEATGESYADVLANRIFRPLGMHNSFVGLGGERISDVASCHISEGPGVALPCASQELVPAFQGSGSVAATAADMTLLMKALLNEGSLGETQLLSENAFSQLTDFDQYRFHPRGPGLGLGIRELDRGSRPAFGHGGGISGFANQMDLFPDERIGVYVGINGGPEQIYEARLSRLPRLARQRGIAASVSQSIRAMERFGAALTEEFLPSTVDSAGLAAGGDPIDARELAGFYVFNRFTSNSLLVNLTALGVSTHVTALSPEELSISGAGRFLADGSGAFHSADRDSWVAFRLADELSWLSFGGDPYSIYERRAALATPLFLLQLPAIAIVLLPCLSLLSIRRLGWLPRSAARSALFGWALLLVALLLELEFATQLLEVEGKAWPVLLWRLLGVLGLLGIAYAPVAAWRRSGGGRRLASGVTAAALTVAATSIVSAAGYWIATTYL